MHHDISVHRLRIVDMHCAELCLNRVLTEVVSVSNRVEPELLKLLRWRQRFVASLQEQLQYLGHQFSVICPRLNLEELD